MEVKATDIRKAFRAGGSKYSPARVYVVQPDGTNWAATHYFGYRIGLTTFGVLTAANIDPAVSGSYEAKGSALTAVEVDQPNFAQVLASAQGRDDLAPLDFLSLGSAGARLTCELGGVTVYVGRVRVNGASQPVAINRSYVDIVEAEASVTSWWAVDERHAVVGKNAKDETVAIVMPLVSHVSLAALRVSLTDEDESTEAVNATQFDAYPPEPAVAV